MSDSEIILGLETSTHACSIALFYNGQFFSGLNIEPKKHSELILPMIQSLLAEVKLTMGDITAIAVGVGPGSFTGVRVAVGLAKAFAFALKVPVWPISSLRALAHQVYRINQCGPQDIVLSTWDARIQQIYWGLFQLDQSSQHKTVCSVDNQVDQLCAPHELVISDLLEKSQGVRDNGFIVVGNGLSHYKNAVMGVIAPYNPKIIEDYYPNAQDVIELAISDKANALLPADLFELSPEYVRNDVAKVPQNMSLRD
tara:strand:- start:47670 stop:48434 length:765 start_codon:yes stop_codon:yes gene_type:complete